MSPLSLNLLQINKTPLAPPSPPQPPLTHPIRGALIQEDSKRF